MSKHVDLLVSVNYGDAGDTYMSSENKVRFNIQTILDAHIPQYNPQVKDVSSIKANLVNNSQRVTDLQVLLARIYHNQDIDGTAKMAIEDTFGGVVPRP